MNNAFYGKTMENERDRVNIKFTRNEKQFLKCTNSPLFANQILVINPETLQLVKMHQKIVKLTKPIYTGAVILELSKLLMYQFHYDTMKKVYPNSLMLKTDTDSLLYFIETKDLYMDMKDDELLNHAIEFSNYPKNHLLYNNDRKKVPGYFQDESVDSEFLIISEYVGLRSKSYVNKIFNKDKNTYQSKKKAKGVPRIHLKKNIEFEDYKTCLTEKKNIKLSGIVRFQSHGLKTYTKEMSKIALSWDDNKRIPMGDKIHTFAHGHYSLKAC